jgi:hypothetical protein
MGMETQGQPRTATGKRFKDRELKRDSAKRRGRKEVRKKGKNMGKEDRWKKGRDGGRSRWATDQSGGELSAEQIYFSCLSRSSALSR